MLVAKTKALISCAFSAQLICVFVFSYANCWISDVAAHQNDSMLSSSFLSKRFLDFFSFNIEILFSV